MKLARFLALFIIGQAGIVNADEIEKAIIVTGEGGTRLCVHDEQSSESIRCIGLTITVPVDSWKRCPVFIIQGKPFIACDPNA